MEGKVDDIPKPIRQGVSQLQYGWLPLLWPHVTEALDGGRRPPLFEPFDGPEPRETNIFSQFIVTTAPLLVARRDLSIADVERADTLSAITDPADVVEIMTGVTDELLRHQRTVVTSYRDWTRTDPLDDADRAALTRWGKYASRLQRTTPSIFVVTYEALQTHLEKQMQSLKEMATRAAEKVAKASDLVHPWDERMQR